ncbi:MAG: hypothetical protein K2I82_01325 [Ruminococcus sp.]|nr:hypothetical protein [Ruminococcus sp.]
MIFGGCYYEKNNEEIYKKNIGTYKYNSDYNPNDDYCVDSSLDMFIKYGTDRPNFDKNDYSKPMRDYKKTE